MMNDFFTVVQVLVIILAILGATYFTTKHVGRIAARSGQSAYMKMEDRMVLGQDKSIAIIKIGTTHYLVGISQEGINILKEIEEEDLIPVPSDNLVLSSGAFLGQMKQMMSKKDGQKR